MRGTMLLQTTELIIVSSIEMAMSKEDKIWKINNLDVPKFDKFTLPQAEQPTEE